MKIKIKRLLFTLLTSLTILTGSIFNSIPVSAANVLLSVRYISYANMTTIQTYMKSNKPNWFADYNYYMWFYGTEIILTIIPKINANQLIFGNNEYDSTHYNDIDTWYLLFSCSDQSKCFQYHFNGSTFAYVGTDTIINSNNSYNVTANSIFYSNIGVYTYSSFFNSTTSGIDMQVIDPQYIPDPDAGPSTTTKINGGLYGILPFPTDWTILWGYTIDKTDTQLATNLITANWGMFQWFADGINAIWASAQPIMYATNTGINGITSGLSTFFTSLSTNFTNNINALTSSTSQFFSTLGTNFSNNMYSLGQTFNNIIAPVSSGVSDVYQSLMDLPGTISSGFEYYFVYNEDPGLIWHLKSEELLAKVPYFNSVSQFFNNLSADGTTMAPITGTVFGTMVSFDIKQAVFDPFSPVADLVKYIFRFVVWIGFAKLLWKQVQTMLNGSSVSSGAQ